MTALEGFNAAAAGATRDASQSAEWLEGFDGYHTGTAANAAAKAARDAERDAYNARPDVIKSNKIRAARARNRYRCSGTPRSL